MHWHKHSIIWEHPLETSLNLLSIINNTQHNQFNPSVNSKRILPLLPQATVLQVTLTTEQKQHT